MSGSWVMTESLVPRQVLSGLWRAWQTVLSSASTRGKFFMTTISPKGKAFKPQMPTNSAASLIFFVVFTSLVDDSQSFGQVDPEHPPPHDIVAFFMLSLLVSCCSGFFIICCSHSLTFGKV